MQWNGCQGSGGEGSAGVVVAAADDGVAAVGERAIGDGALHAGDTGDPPCGAPARTEDQTNPAQAGALAKHEGHMSGSNMS